MNHLGVFFLSSSNVSRFFRTLMLYRRNYQSLKGDNCKGIPLSILLLNIVEFFAVEMKNKSQF